MWCPHGRPHSSPPPRTRRRAGTCARGTCRPPRGGLTPATGVVVPVPVGPAGVHAPSTTRQTVPFASATEIGEVDVVPGHEPLTSTHVFVPTNEVPFGLLPTPAFAFTATEGSAGLLLPM